MPYLIVLSHYIFLIKTPEKLRTLIFRKVEISTQWLTAAVPCLRVRSPRTNHFVVFPEIIIIITPTIDARRRDD